MQRFITFLDRQNGFADNTPLQVIYIKYIQENDRVKIVNILSQSDEIKLDKSQILIEIKWLVKEGYIKEFSDGTISC